MPPTRLGAKGTGGIELMTWFNQGQGVNPVTELGDFIQPTIEMAPFQTRRIYITDTQSVAQGDQAAFLITVPPNRAFEIDFISVTQADAGTAHRFQGQFQGQFGGLQFARSVLFAPRAAALINTLLYPITVSPNVVMDGNDFLLIPPLRLYQDELLNIQDQTAVVAAGPVDVTIRIVLHEIPIAVSIELDNDLIVGSTF